MRTGRGKEMGCGRHTGWFDVGGFKPFFYCGKIVICDFKRIELIAMERNFDTRIARPIYGIDCI
jgi:hypothetical protein